MLDLPPYASTAEAHAKAIAAGARCSECPLYGCHRGPVYGDVVPGALITIVGEAPGRTEVETGAVFRGWSGRVLTTALAAGGVDRNQVSVTNVLLCQPPPPDSLGTWLYKLGLKHRVVVAQAQEAGRNPPVTPPTPIECCRPRLEKDIAASGSRFLLGVGKYGLRALAEYAGLPYGGARKDATGKLRCGAIKKQHGAPIQLPDGRVLCSSLHPAFASRTRPYMPVVRRDLARAAAIARRGYIDWAEPQYRLFPTPDVVDAVCSKFLAHREQAVAVDIETNPGTTVQTCHIRCVGLGAQLPRMDGSWEEVVIVVPFRHMDGTPYWLDTATGSKVANAVRQVIDSCPLIAHNGAFDTSVMLRLGLMSDSRKKWFDTMLAHHDTPANDLPHDLGFVTRSFLEVPMWKGDVDHKSAPSVENERDLHLYNARDVLATLRIAGPLARQLDLFETRTQFDTDSQLAYVTRDMGNLGLVIDEVERGRLSRSLNEKCARAASRLRDIVGFEINPNAPHELAEWLFVTKGYTPPLNPQGHEWEEGDEASTSVQALLRLVDLGVDDQTDAAIDTILEYRGFDKLRGTYVDGLKVRSVDWQSFGRDSASVGWADEVRHPVKGSVLLPRRRALSILNTTYKVHVIPSGRLSTQPAIQNWPAVGRANMRRMVVAPPRHVIVTADYAQIEARLYALVAQDQLLLHALSKGLDIHSLNAASLFADKGEDLMSVYDRIERAPKAKRKYFRLVAKRFCFLEIYGGEEKRLYSVMSTDRDKVTGKRTFPDLKPDDVKVWHERWHRLHPETAMWHSRCAAVQSRYGYIATIVDGRRRFFPGGPQKKNAVPNHVIQGSAADIANRGLLRIEEAIPHRRWSPLSGLFLQVHDEIGVVVPEHRAEEAKRLVEDCMYYEQNGVKFPAEASIVRCWADAA